MWGLKVGVGLVGSSGVSGGVILGGFGNILCLSLGGSGICLSLGGSGMCLLLVESIG